MRIRLDSHLANYTITRAYLALVLGPYRGQIVRCVVAATMVSPRLLVVAGRRNPNVMTSGTELVNPTTVTRAPWSGSSVRTSASCETHTRRDVNQISSHGKAAHDMSRYMRWSCFMQRPPQPDLADASAPAPRDTRRVRSRGGESPWYSVSVQHRGRRRFQVG